MIPCGGCYRSKGDKVLRLPGMAPDDDKYLIIAPITVMSYRMRKSTFIRPDDRKSIHSASKILMIKIIFNVSIIFGKKNKVFLKHLK